MTKSELKNIIREVLKEELHKERILAEAIKPSLVNEDGIMSSIDNTVIKYFANLSITGTDIKTKAGNKLKWHRSTAENGRVHKYTYILAEGIPAEVDLKSTENLYDGLANIKNIYCKNTREDVNIEINLHTTKVGITKNLILVVTLSPMPGYMLSDPTNRNERAALDDYYDYYKN